VTTEERPLHSSLDTINEALNTKYWCWSIFEAASEAPKTLLDLLKRNLPDIDPSSWPMRFDFGGIYVNGRLAEADQPLPYPCRVEYYQPKFEISDAHHVFPQFLATEHIIYQDEDILVVYKPPGISSAPAKEQRHYSLKSAIERTVCARIHLPSRLDFSAQGLVIVSRLGAASKGLQNAFANRLVTKEYLCASAAQCAWDTLRVDLAIGRDDYHPVVRRIDPINGQDALTYFERLGRVAVSDLTPGRSALTVFRARPVTGRTHQIRVHAAASGIALAGDRFYRGIDSDHLHLISHSLRLRHPVSNKELYVELPERLKPWWLR
jgi:23S rRNA-/tRNA-specific pseudouridylate synthase